MEGAVLREGAVWRELFGGLCGGSCGWELCVGSCGGSCVGRAVWWDYVGELCVGAGRSCVCMGGGCVGGMHTSHQMV